jgi:hypothetical protein
MRNFLAARAAKSRRALLVISCVVPLVVLLVNGFLAKGIGPLETFRLFGPAGLVIACSSLVIALAIDWTTRRDLRKSVYVQTTGRITLWSARHGFSMSVAGRRFSLSFPMFQQLSGLREGEVDSTKYGNDILEVRASDGRVVFRHPGYHPDSLKNSRPSKGE